MSFLIVRTFLFAIGLSLLACARSAAGQEKITPTDYPCDKYKGELAVFGRLTTTRPGVQLDQARVKLKRNGGDTLIVDADKEGRYCIRYPSGSDIARLSFEDGEITCVDQISGTSSHYINKVLDNDCALLRATGTELGPNTAAIILTSAVAKKFRVWQVAVSNSSGGVLQIVSFQFERETSKQDQSVKASDVIVPVDPDMVELVAARQRPSVCLLCVGPVTLFQIPIHAHASDAAAYIRSHALRVNDTIPDGQGEAKLIFVDKSNIPNNISQPGALGTLVIRATRWTKAGESTLSTVIAGEKSAGSFAHPGGDSAGNITALAKIK